MNILGFTLVERDPDRALALFDEAIELGSALGLPLPLGYALGLSAVLYARRGNAKEAAKRFREALDVAMLRGDLRQLGSVLGQVAVTLDEFGAASPAAIVRGAAEAVMPGALLGIEVGTGGEAARSRRHLEEVLGTTLYATLRGQGAALDADEAVRLAVAELENVVKDREQPAPSVDGGPRPSSGVLGQTDPVTEMGEAPWTGTPTSTSVSPRSRSSRG